MKIETRYYSNCNLVHFNYSTVYNIMVFGIMYYILYDMNFSDTTNCISYNDRLADYVLKWRKK